MASRFPQSDLPFNPIRKFGEVGYKKGELDYPHGLTLYRNESIYIADTLNSRIQIFSTAGEFLEEFGREQLNRPHSIIIYDEWVFVSDCAPHVNGIIKFQITNNEYVCRSDYGRLNDPHGITVNTNGEVLVADYYKNRIAVLHSDLKIFREIGKGQLVRPRDVKINKNNIFVADNNKINNIHIFTESGDIIRSFIKLDKGTGNIYLCFDLDNNIIISDGDSKLVQIFKINGELIYKFVCKSNPNGIALDNNNNIICACFDGVVYIY